MRVRTGVKAGKALGDSVYDFTHATGMNKLAEWYTDLTGLDCGCRKRQDALNNLFPG